MPNSARIQVTLVEIDTQPWRRLEVPLSLSLNGLHECIQAAFLWTNSHLWEFEINERRYSDVMDNFDGFGGPEEKIAKARNTTLETIAKSGVTEFYYVYDMGDDWVHLIEIEELFDADTAVKYPRYLEGKLAAPPDDCGGPPGFESFREIMASPKHPEHDELRDWYGGPFDPDNANEDRIVAGIKRLANRRRKKT